MYLYSSILLMLTCAVPIKSFSMWKAEPLCEKPLIIGQVIMGQKVVGSNERFLQVFRGDLELVSGDTYNSDDLLIIRISDTSDETLYEARGGASFRDGECSGSRLRLAAHYRDIVLLLPAHEPSVGDVSIVAGWVAANDQIKLTPEFRLVRKDGQRTSRVHAPAIDSSTMPMDKNTVKGHKSTKVSEKKVTIGKDYKGEDKENNDKVNKEKVNKEKAVSSGKERGGKMSTPPAQGRVEEKAVPAGREKGERKTAPPAQGRVALTLEERRREIEKIRDRELFGLHGQDGPNSHSYRKKAAQSIPAPISRDLPKPRKLTSYEKMASFVRITLLRWQRRARYYIVYIYSVCAFFLCIFFYRLYSGRQKIARYFSKMHAYEL